MCYLKNTYIGAILKALSRYNCSRIKALPYDNAVFVRLD